MWLENAVASIPQDWVIHNAGVNYMNNRWRVGLSAGPAQKDLFGEPSSNART